MIILCRDFCCFKSLQQQPDRTFQLDKTALSNNVDLYINTEYIHIILFYRVEATGTGTFGRAEKEPEHFTYNTGTYNITARGV